MSSLRAVTVITGQDTNGKPVQITGVPVQTLHFNPTDFVVEVDNTTIPPRVIVRRRLA